MLPDPVQGALNTLTDLFSTRPGLVDAVRAQWRAGSGLDANPGLDSLVPEDVVAAADELSAAMPALTTTEEHLALLCESFGGPAGETLFSWCKASTWRRDVQMARLLSAAASHDAFREDVPQIAHDRVVEGPLVDALACAPLLGGGAQLALPRNAEARARLEILIWEAGASALEVPHLGRWLWGSSDTFDEMVRIPAHGALRGRVLAARCLEVTVGGMPPMTDPELVGRTLQLLQPLLLHPEPLVWVHAARALGRLTGPVEQLEGTLLDWVVGASPVLRQRALTAIASLPAERLTFLAASQLITIIGSPEEDAWVLAAIAAATPYLFFSRRDLWDRLAKRILGGDGGAISARGLARGLTTLWRRGTNHEEIAAPLRALREMARRARSESLDESRRWIEVIAVTDVLDAAERDPLDLELGLENLMRIAAQYDDEEADARAARFALTLTPAFTEARRIATGPGRVRQRAAAMNALEGCGRAFALRLWTPLLRLAQRACTSRSRTSRRRGRSSRVRRRRSSTSSRSVGPPALRSTRSSRSRCSRSGSAATRSTRAAPTETSATAAARQRTTRASGSGS